MFLVLCGLFLGFQKNQISSRIGKSIGCIAFLLVNWAIIYDVSYIMTSVGLFSISDVWRWFPAIIFTGILGICLLIIWRPFNDKILLKAMLGLAGIMMLLTVVTVLTWKDDVIPPSILTYWIEDTSIFAEFGRIISETWYVHIISLVVAFFTYLSFKKKKITTRIGKSGLCAFFSFWVWGVVFLAPFRPQVPVWDWLISIICIGIFLICLFYIWKSSRFYNHDRLC